VPKVRKTKLHPITYFFAISSLYYVELLTWQST